MTWECSGWAFDHMGGLLHMFEFNQGRMAKKIHAHKNNNDGKYYFWNWTETSLLLRYTFSSFKEAKLSICSLISKDPSPKMEIIVWIFPSHVLKVTVSV